MWMVDVLFVFDFRLYLDGCLIQFYTAFPGSYQLDIAFGYGFCPLLLLFGLGFCWTLDVSRYGYYLLDGLN